MLHEHICLHEGGHGHEGCSHHHEHTGAELTPEQTLALMSYMLEHNRSHADELHNICHALEDQGKTDASALVAESVHYFDHCNEKLEEALKLVKGE